MRPLPSVRALLAVAALAALLGGCALQAQVPSSISSVKKDVGALKKDTGAVKKSGGIIKRVISKAKAVNHKLGAVRKLLCVFHSYRAIQDIIHHHPGWGALQVWRAARTCRPRK